MGMIWMADTQGVSIPVHYTSTAQVSRIDQSPMGRYKPSQARWTSGGSVSLDPVVQRSWNLRCKQIRALEGYTSGFSHPANLHRELQIELSLRDFGGDCISGWGADQFMRPSRMGRYMHHSAAPQVSAPHLTHMEIWVDLVFFFLVWKTRDNFFLNRDRDLPRFKKKLSLTKKKLSLTWKKKLWLVWTGRKFFLIE